MMSRLGDVDAESLSSISFASASFCSAAGSCFSEGSSGSFEIESEVGRDALIQICCSALSRLLDFPDSQLEILLGTDDDQVPSGEDDGGTNVARNIASSLRMMKRSIGSGLHAISHKYHHQRQPNQGVQDIKQGPDAMSDGEHRLVFGTSITSSGQIILLQIMAHMESYASCEGIFRKSGSKQRIEQLGRDLREKDFRQILLSEMYKPHDYASLLKQFFSELLEPLFLKRHLYAYLQTAGLTDAAAITKSLQLLMLLLPPSHRIVAQHLLQLLSLVVSSRLQSKMDEHNLALVFAPTLFLSSNMARDPSSVRTLEKLVSLLQYMIRNPLEIFEVPHEVQAVAERFCKKREATREEDIALDMYSSCCHQENSADFHATGKEKAASEVAALYEAVKNMPDGPQKTLFLKKLECKPVTPSSTKKSRTRTKCNKENFATPKAASRHSKHTSKSSKKPPHPPLSTPSSNRVALGEVADTHPGFKTPKDCPRPTLMSIPTMSPMVTDV